MPASKNEPRISTKEVIKRSLYPEMVINWFFGLGIIEYPIGNSWPKFSLAYSLLCLVVYGFLSRLTANFVKEKRTMIDPDPLDVDTELFLCNLFVIMVTVGAYVYNQVYCKCFLYESFADEIFDELGIWTKSLANGPKFHVVYFGYIAWTTLSITIESLYLFSEETPMSLRSIIINCTYHYPVLLMCILDANVFLITSSRVHSKLHVITDILNNMLTEGSKKNQVVDEISNIKNFVPIDSKSINLIKKSHMYLEKEICSFGPSFGLFIVLSITLSFIVITWELYDVYFMLFVNVWSGNLSKKLSIQALFYTFQHCCKLYLLCWLAGLMTLESRKAGAILGQIYSLPSVRKDVQNEIQNYLTQLIISPLQLSAWGFFFINDDLFLQIMQTTTTWLIIFIQLKRLAVKETA